MSETLKELTVEELIEKSDCKSKDLILSRLKEENEINRGRICSMMDTINEQRNVIESYRTVLKDMTYSIWLLNS